GERTRGRVRARRRIRPQRVAMAVALLRVARASGARARPSGARPQPGRDPHVGGIARALAARVPRRGRARARDASPAALDMEATWGHARGVLLAASAVPGASLLGASRRLNGRSRRGVLAADLAACAAYRPAAEALAGLAMPTLVVAGKRDQMTPWKAGKALAERIPGSRFVPVDAGHSMMSEAPRDVLWALREFLAGSG